MSNLQETPLRESYRLCSRIARQASSSFYASFWLLPTGKRRAMCALYAFSRHCDDLVDSTAGVQRRAQQLVEWRAAFEAALMGEFHHPMLPAVADTIVRFKIEPSYLHDLIDGMEMDLHTCRYRTFDELHQYCYRVASAVGLACLPVWGLRQPEITSGIYNAAVQCGLAFQLTNILRDVRQDAETGRIYLPQEDLQNAGYGEDDLLQNINDDRFRQLMEFQIRRAEQCFDDARPLLPALTPGGQRVLATMMRTYEQLLASIKRQPAAVLQRRVSLSWATKARILLRGFAG